MKNIVIVPKVAIPKPFGMDRGYNLFKKALSTQFKEKLNQQFENMNMNYKASVDTTFDSLEDLILAGANVVLISPYIKDKVSTSELNRNEYYILSRDEFDHTQVEHVITFLKEISVN